MKFEFIEAEKAGPISVLSLCKALRVSKSSYYDWRKRDRRTPTPRQLETKELTDRVAELHRRSRGTYGRPRLMHALKEEGWRIGPNRLRRIMLQTGIYGRKRRRGRKHGPADADAPAANLLERNFEASRRDQVWCGDITEYRVRGRRLFLAVVIDLFSRRVVGLAFGTDATTDLVVRAMLDALRRRGPSDGVIFHSDQGVQYRSVRFRRLASVHGITQSMSRAGNCLDNAVAESFFATLEHELASRRDWNSIAQAKRALREFTLDFYNSVRMHSTLNYLSPNDFEVAHLA